MGEQDREKLIALLKEAEITHADSPSCWVSGAITFKRVLTDDERRLITAYMHDPTIIA